MPARAPSKPKPAKSRRGAKSPKKTAALRGGPAGAVSSPGRRRPTRSAGTAGRKQGTPKAGGDSATGEAFPRPERGEALRQRAARINQTLGKLYGAMGTALHFADPFQLIVATVLSAQSTDEQVNRVTPALFKRFPDPASLAAADAAEVEKLVHSTGFYKQKTKSIQSLARDLMERFGGEVPRDMEELTSLRGVGRKTANCVRSQAFGLPGVIVDTHFKRLAQRMALVDTDDPDKIETQMCAILPEAEWANISNAFIWHGRKTCFARKPDCVNCSVLSDCPTGKKLLGRAAG